jgi:RND family efflux transporter MFP subunit
MKTTTKFLILIISVTSFLYSCGDKNESAEKKEVDTESISVKVASIENTLNENKITASGLLTTENEARYSFKIGGIIDRIYVSEGETFKNGQLLASLKLTEIDAGLSQASIGLEKAQRDYRRVSNLYKDSVATLEQLQDTKTNLDIAQKTLDAIAFNKKYAYIYASANGFVTKKIANEGEIVNVGMPVLAINENANQSDWLLKVGVTDKEWAAIEIGNKASIRLDAFPDKTFDAKVFRKSQAADAGSSSFQIEMKIELGNTKPAVGMFGKTEIATNHNENVISIPYSSLVEVDGNIGFVFTAVGDNKVKKVPVTILKFDNERVYLKDKLNEIGQIIISNSAYLNEKSTIKIIQ